MADTTKPADNTWYGLLAMAAGIGIALMVHLNPQSGDAPAWVGDACAAAFFCAGVSIVAQPRGWHLLTRLAGLFAAYMLVVPGIWVALAGDPEKCSIGLAFGSFALDSGAGALCRGVFGVGALLTLLLAVLLTWQAFRGRRAN